MELSSRCLMNPCSERSSYACHVHFNYKKREMFVKTASGEGEVKFKLFHLISKTHFVVFPPLRMPLKSLNTEAILLLRKITDIKLLEFSLQCLP